MIVDSHSHTDCNPRTQLPFKIKPDVTIYPPGTKSTVKTDSTKADMFIEFKWETTDDAFCVDVSRECPDSTSSENKTCQSFLRDSKAAADTLGQVTSYAVAQLGAQFRTHIYSVLIVRDTARILRWDRSGTIVTEPIKYNKTRHLAEFFRRYSKASPAMRGKDKTASSPNREESFTARTALGLERSCPLVKLSVPTAEGTSYFITSAPEPTAYTPPGRATRGFKAYDISSKRVVYLKDSWRIDLPSIHAEGLVYKMLNDANVRNVPYCLASGDISTPDYHATKTHNYAVKPWACHSHSYLIPHRHHRVVLSVVGRALVQYKSSFEMVSSVRDALIGECQHRIWSPGLC